MAGFVRAILRYRFMVLALLLASVTSAVYACRTIRVRFQFADLYSYSENPALPLYKEDNQEFGDPAGYVVTMIDAPDVFAPEVLTYVQQVTDELTPLPIFSRVRSLVSATAIRANGDEVVAGPLFGREARVGADREALRRYALQSPLLLRRVVAGDAKTTAILAQMRAPAVLATIDEQSDAIDAVTAALRRHSAPAGVSARVTGAPRVEVETTHALISDQLYLVPAVICMLAMMLYVTFRSWHGVVLALTAVTTATIWTAGIFSLFGRPVDIMGSVVPTTLLVYGVVDPIFVLVRVLQKADAGLRKEAAIVEAFSELALPCFLTSITTAIGFAAFATADVPSIQYLGITVGIGVIMAWITTVTVLPLMLAFAPLPRRPLVESRVSRLLDRWLVSAWSMLSGRAAVYALLSVVLLGAGAWYARVQNVSNDYVGSLPRGSVQDDVRLLERRLAGVVRLNVHLEGAVDCMKTPAVLQAVERLDLAFSKLPLTTFSISLADVVAEANQAFSGGDPSDRRVPNSRQLIAQYLTMVEPSDRSELVSADYARSHIAVLVRDEGSKPTLRQARVMEQLINDSGLAALGVRASLTGNGIVAYPELDKAVVELMNGFVVAFIVVLVFEALLLRSLRIALISVIPNLLPVVACFVTTRALGISLRIDTTLVLCVTIGGLFNTTIHYSARVLQRVRDGAEDPDEVLLHAMRAVGPPAVFTAVTLSAGFACFLLSGFGGSQVFGLLSAITLLSGVVSDMLVTTVLMRLGFNWRAAKSAVATVEKQPQFPGVDTAHL